MTFFEFLILLFENVNLYIIGLISCGILMIVLLKRQTFSLLDPMSIGILLITIYLNTVFFLYELGYIADFYLYNCIFSFMALIIGLNINGKPQIRKKITAQSDYRVYNVFFIAVVLICIVVRSYLFITYGAPLLVEGSDRGSFYSKDTFLNTVSDSFMIAAIFLIIDKTIITKKCNYMNIVCMLFIFVILFLNGSKSAFASVFFYLFIYKFYFTNQSLKIKKYILVLIPLLFSLIIFIKSDNDLTLTTINIIVALANRADTYIYIYTSSYSDLLRYFDNGFFNFLKTIFYIPLTNFKIVSPENFLFFSNRIELYIYNDYGSLGPNAISMLIGLVYLGPIGNVIYSFITGYIISFFRNKLIKYICINNVFIRYIFFVIQIKVISLISAPTLFWGNFMQNMLFIGSIYLSVVVFSKIAGKSS